MDFERFLNSEALARLEGALGDDSGAVRCDLDRAASLDVTREMYQEADNRGLTLSELLETDEYDPSATGSTVDAFERQLLLAGIRAGEK